MAFNAPGEDINPDQETTITPESNPVGSGNGSLSGYFSKMDAANDVALSLDNSQDFEQQKDVTALNLSAKDNPIQTRDQASKILKLEMDTGLPTEFINDNLAEVEKEASAGAFDIEHFRQTSPKFAQFVASHPAHLPLFGDSLKQFQEIENKTRFSDGVDEASLMAKKSQFISKRFDGVQTPADIKAEAELDKQISQLEFLKEGRSFSDMVSSSMGYTVRQAGDSMGAAAVGAGVGFGVGASMAPFTGGASIPAMGVVGAKIGSLSAVALQAYEMETNFAYDEIRQVPGIDNESAKNVARAVGALNAAIETGSQVFLLRRLPGFEKLFDSAEGAIRKNATKLATKALARETTREAVLTSAKKVAQIGGSESAEEFVQSLIGSSGLEIASRMNDVDSGQTFWGSVSTAGEESKQALMGSVGTFGLLHASTNLYKHIDRVKQGDKNAQMFDAIAGGVQSEAFKALPDKGQEALRAILSDSGAQTTYFQSDAWDAYWKEKGVDPREIAVQVAQDGGASYDQAFDSTGFIAIPTERVGRKLLHNNEHKELLMDATTDVTKATPREALKAQEEMQKEIEAAKADQKKTEVQSTNALEDKMYKALTDARVPGDARTQAKLFSKIAGTLAKSEGKTAEDLVAPYALEISRIMSERVRQQSIDKLDPILEQIRAGKVPEESTARGESLVSFLKNKGGISLEGLGGDVAALQPDKKRQTYKRLSQKKGGIDFDKAVEIAHESGYIKNRDNNELLDAIAKELAGDPVYSPQFEDSNALENIRVTNEYIRHMKSLGIDLSKMDNETVKKILAENKAQTPVDQGERDDIFLQEERKLIAQHNISSRGLLHANSMGGLAAPSLAITEVNAPLTNFGEITLIGTKSMIDPKQGAKVFASDVYSPRYPKVRFDFYSKNFDKMQKILKQFSEAVGGSRISESDLEWEGHKALVNDAAFIAKFLVDKGHQPKIVLKALDTKKLKEFQEAGLMDESFGVDRWNIVESEVFFHKAVEYYKKIFKKLKSKDALTDLNGSTFENPLGHVKGMIHRLAGEVSEFHKAKKGEVDEIDTRRSLKSQVEKLKLSDELDSSAKKFFKETLEPSESIASGVKSNGETKYVDHTIDNVIAVLRKNIRGGENFNYGTGSVRAMHTPEFKSVKNIKDESHKLISDTEFKEIKEEINKEFYQVADDLKEFHNAPESFHFFDAVTSMMSDMSIYNLSKALEDNGFNNVTEEAKEKITDFIDKLVDMPTAYFEAKLLREVKLEEFSGAVIPKSTSKEVKEILKKAGIKTIQYDNKANNGDDSSRAEAIKKLAGTLQSKGYETYFQGGIPKSIKIDGVNRPTTNSEGKQIGRTEEEVKNFYKWFGDSKVVDDQGRPLVVYHVSKAKEIKSFDSKYKTELSSMGFHFGTKEQADFRSKQYDYNSENKNIGAYYIAINNPLKVSHMASFAPDHLADVMIEKGILTEDQYNSIQDKAMNDSVEVGEALGQILSQNGVGGLVYENDREGDGLSYVPIDSVQIKSASDNVGSYNSSNPNVFYQGMSQPNDLGFYSRMIRTIEEKMGTSASVEQVNGMLKEIKPEERKWLGLDEYLKGKTKVNKEELLQYLRANDLQIKEIAKENTSKMKFVSKSEADDLIEKGINVFREDGSGPIDETAGFPDDYKFRVVNSGKNETKFEGHTLPGGENYREVLFTLPTDRNTRTKAEEIRFIQLSRGGYTDPNDPHVGDEIKKEYAELAAKSPANYYKSSHFIEPNVLAHTRLNDRTDSDGKKVLFIEEVQSDWHQQGRKYGYNDIETAKENENIETKISILKNELLKNSKEIKNQLMYLDIYSPDNMDAAHVYDGEFLKLYLKLGDSESENEVLKLAKERKEISENIKELELKYRNHSKAVIDAPFKKTWHEFVLKRIIRMAAEQGYDKIAWTTGEQQAERYDLSKHLSSIKSIPYDNGGYQVQLYGTNGSIIKTVEVNDLSEIEEWIGKEPTQKLIEKDKENNGKTSVLSGLDLKIGGEGMKGFYDKILVDFANKFGKKYGARVGDLELSTGPAMYNIIDGFRGGKSEVVHSLEITPKLKETALNDGFTLFQKKDTGPLGQLRIGTNRKMNIDLYAKADFSTFAHEQAHFWLEVMGDIAESPEGSERVKQIYADALEYLGVKNRLEIKREHHEKFAESFEKYLMEGKAPTPALQRLFNTFRAWLEFVYSGLRNLNVKISPQIRSVFDRMLATDEEIAAAQKEQSFEKLILDPIAAGLTDEQLEKYSKLHEEAKQEATNSLLVKMMKQLQRERTLAWKNEEREVREQVTKDVNERVDIKLVKMLKAGKLEYMGGMPAKLDKKTLIEAYGKEFVDKLPRGIFGKDGMSHDALASLLGFENGWDLVEMLANTPSQDELIDQMVQDEMVSRHGDQDVYLNGTLQEAAMEAIHSDKQAELMRMEYDYLQQQKTKETKGLVKSITRRAPTVQQVRQKAEEIIAQESVGSLMPYQYLRAEKKHANNAIDFLQKGDIDNALDSKKKELLNHELYRAATLAKENVVKIEGRLNKFFQEDSKIGKNRDMQLIGAGRAILSGYGFGTNPKTPDQHLEQMKKYDPDGYAVLIDRVNAALENADFYKNLTYEKFLALNDVLDGIWQQSKSSMLIKVEGQKLLQRDAIDTLLGAVSKLPANSVRINESTQSPGQARLQGLLSKVATLKRVEAKLGVMDEYTDGEFKKYFFNSVREATEVYRSKKADLIRRFNALVQANKDNFGGKEIIASSLNFTFKNKGELLAAMLHTGNESNFKKLILGNGWGELREDKTLDSLKWDAFIEDSQMTGVLTKADYDFVQGVWDLFESFKAEAQGAHYEMNGFYFGEIVGKPIKTPWGEYKGGYVPATPDNTRSKESAIRNEKYQIEDNFARELPPKVDGFTKNRVENFSTPLLMDLTAIPFQIDRTIRYTYITPRVKEVLKLVHNRELRAALDGYDPHFVDQILVPFLSRATTQTTVIHTDSKFSDQFYSFAKNNAAIQIMFANIPNIVQQTANYIPAALRAGPGFLFNAVKNSVLHNKELTQSVAEKSLFMRNQLERTDEKARFETEKVLEDLNKFESANEWVRSNAYIGQIYLQNIMNVQVWMASYDQAQANGLAEDESVRYADSAVRETQSSMAAEDTAAIETDKPIMKALMMFYGFFNNMGNLYASEWTKASQQPGSRAIAKKAMIAANFGLFAFAGQIIVDGLKGHIGEDDDDKESLEFWLKYYFGASFSLVAPMAGVFGQLAQVGVKNLTNSNSYGNRVSVSPLISGPEQIIGTIAKVASGKEVGDKEKVKGAMSLMGMVPLMGFVPVGAIPGVSVKVADKVANLTRLSGSAAVLGALKKPVGYAVGVQEGKDKADNYTDIMKGIMSGSAK